jgi:hypothetical protein
LSKQWIPGFIHWFALTVFTFKATVPDGITVGRYVLTVALVQLITQGVSGHPVGFDPCGRAFGMVLPGMDYIRLI